MKLKFKAQTYQTAAVQAVVYCFKGKVPQVTALLTQLPWTHHLVILSQSKRKRERMVSGETG